MVVGLRKTGLNLPGVARAIWRGGEDLPTTLDVREGGAHKRRSGRKRKTRQADAATAEFEKPSKPAGPLTSRAKNAFLECDRRRLAAAEAAGATVTRDTPPKAVRRRSL